MKKTKRSVLVLAEGSVAKNITIIGKIRAIGSCIKIIDSILIGDVTIIKNLAGIELINNRFYPNWETYKRTEGNFIERVYYRFLETLRRCQGV
ncbi:MAG: hypothetical protein PQJ59_16865 [Spirochaetales bacterium]|nr:hypothetical protein [Spirochaetales bacterium]